MELIKSNLRNKEPVCSHQSCALTSASTAELQQGEQMVVAMRQTLDQRDPTEVPGTDLRLCSQVIFDRGAWHTLEEWPLWWRVLASVQTASVTSRLQIATCTLCNRLVVGIVEGKSLNSVKICLLSAQLWPEITHQMSNLNPENIWQCGDSYSSNL